MSHLVPLRLPAISTVFDQLVRAIAFLQESFRLLAHVRLTGGLRLRSLQLCNLAHRGLQQRGRLQGSTCNGRVLVPHFLLGDT